MKGRAKTALGLRSVHLGARSLPKPKAKPKSDAKAGISSSANHQSGASAQATATSSRFSRAEIEELQAMLQKAAPQTLQSMSTGRTPLLLSDDPEEKREEIRRYFHATFDKTEQLFDLLTTEEAYYIKHETLRHPPIFYYGHTACFFVNKLILAKTVTERINPKIEHMCAVGVDEMSWDDLNEEHYDWPAVADVKAYRNEVRAMVDNLISELPMDSLINWDSKWWPIIMGIEHENIHTETSSAIFRQVPLDMITLDSDAGSHWRMCEVDNVPPQNELLPVAASKVVYNKDRKNGRVYGWDNEYGHKEAEVPAFKASKYLVSNHEYKEFVDSGGYQDKQWWTEEGWTWVEFSGAQHPKYWLQQDGAWKQRQLAAVTDLPWSWPAVVNQLESKAFCNWKSAQTGKNIRLPSEDEWKVLREMGKYGSVDQPDWSQAPGNINLEYFASECPVNVFEWGGTGFYDVIGNVWQWTESYIDGLPGFEVHPLYDDFSTPTFDGKHTLFKGGSWISMGANGATKDSRYSFRRHFFQHAGIRYVESDVPVDTKMNLYETDPFVLREIDAHFPEDAGLVAGIEPFAKLSAAKVIDVVKNLGKPTGRVLDLGCSVGRRTFELASTFDECVGIDRTARYINTAVRLQDNGIVRYTVPMDGEINSFHEVSLKALDLPDGAAERCQFWQNDAQNLDANKFGTFDVVVAANLIEQLQRPADFLCKVEEFVKPGGLLVLSSTYNWDEAVTPKDKMVGGYKCATSGENVSTLAGVTDLLKGSFVRVEAETADLPDVQRTTLRSMQYDMSEVTVWERI